MQIFWICLISICIGGTMAILAFLFGPAILIRRLDIGAIIVGALGTVGFVFLQLYVFSTRWPFIAIGVITFLVDLLFLFFCWAMSREYD